MLFSLEARYECCSAWFCSEAEVRANTSAVRLEQPTSTARARIHLPWAFKRAEFADYSVSRIHCADAQHMSSW
jgi:hypothetical protein